MRELREKRLSNFVFIDIETARIVDELKLDTPLFDSWEYLKRRNGESNEDLIASFKKEAGLYSEFSRIVCISVGRVSGDTLVMKSYDNEDEKELLSQFNSDLTKVYDHNAKTVFCGHAAIGFDIPFIFQRCMINQVEAHELLDVAGLKPWEVSETIIDTKELWRGTSFRPSSLINIAVAMGIPSPKDDISGAEVGDLYWSKEKDSVARIVKYCEKDVLTTANVVRKCRFEPLLTFASPDIKVEEVKEPFILNILNGGKYGVKEAKELTTYLETLSLDDRVVICDILNAAVSKAKGKVTKMTKVQVNDLKKKFCK